MADYCTICGKNLALVGRAHSCTPKAVVVAEAHDAQAAPRRLLKHGGDRRSAGFQRNAAVTLNGGVPLNRGNTAAYLLAVLDRDRPDLAARVRAKDLSAFAGAVEPGFRKRNYRRSDQKSCHNPSLVAQCR